MDLCRGTAILMVVVMHSFTMPASREVETSDAVISFFMFLTPLRVPVLFALSGMLLAWGLQKPLGSYVVGKMRHLLWPMLLWGIITAYAYGRPAMLNDPWAWVGGVSHLWFLGTLLFCYLIGRLVKFIPAWFFMLLFPVLLATVAMPHPVILKYLFYGTYFMMGAVLWKWRQGIQSLGVWMPLASAVVGLGGCLVTDSSPIHASGLLGLFTPIPWFLLIMWVGPRLPRVAVLESMGRNSVVWYCAHFPVLMFTLRLTMSAGLEDRWVFLAVLTASILVPATLVAAGRWTRPLFSMPWPHASRRRSRSSGASRIASEQHRHTGSVLVMSTPTEAAARLN